MLSCKEMLFSGLRRVLLPPPIARFASMTKGAVKPICMSDYAHSHSIVNGTCKQLSCIELFSASSIFTVIFTVICIGYPKIDFSIYRLLSKTIDDPARVPFGIYRYLSLATFFSPCKLSVSVEDYRQRRFSRRKFTLRDDFETTLLHEVEQLQRGSGGALLTDFPLLHGRDTGIQQRCKYRLADM